jgi:very-short-patch-repair endonuclease
MSLAYRTKLLRARQTDAELRLWYHLRARRFMHLKFRRQVPLGRYIVDFLCTEYRLIVEADGGSTTSGRKRTGSGIDGWQSRAIESCGFGTTR